PGDGNALLAPSAHFIEAHRRDWADKREARCERKQQRKHLIAEGHPRQHDADDRVDKAKEDNVGLIRFTTTESSDQDVLEDGGLNPANRWPRGIPTLLATPHRATQRS